MGNRSDELIESWVNGNRADCADACLRSPSLAVEVALGIPPDDRARFLLMLQSREGDARIRRAFGRGEGR